MSDFFQKLFGGRQTDVSEVENEPEAPLSVGQVVKLTPKVDFVIETIRSETTDGKYWKATGMARITLPSGATNKTVNTVQDRLGNIRSYIIKYNLDTKARAYTLDRRWSRKTNDENGVTCDLDIEEVEV